MSEQIFTLESYENQPPELTPEQLRKFAKFVLAEANDSKTLRRYVNANLEPVYQWYSEDTYVDEDGQEYYTKRSGRLIQRVEGRVNDLDTQHEKPETHLDEWSLRIREMNQFKTDDGEWRGDVKTYSIDWDGEEGAVRADYKLEEVPSRTSEDVRAEVLYGELEGDPSEPVTLTMTMPFDDDQLNEYMRKLRMIRRQRSLGVNEGA